MCGSRWMQTTSSFIVCHIFNNSKELNVCVCVMFVRCDMMRYNVSVCVCVTLSSLVCSLVSIFYGRIYCLRLYLMRCSMIYGYTCVIELYSALAQFNLSIWSRNKKKTKTIKHSHLLHDKNRLRFQSFAFMCFHLVKAMLRITMHNISCFTRGQFIRERYATERCTCCASRYTQKVRMGISILSSAAS